MFRRRNCAYQSDCKKIHYIIDWSVVSEHTCVWIRWKQQPCMWRVVQEAAKSIGVEKLKDEQEKSYAQLSFLVRTCLYRTWPLSA